jgi:hypothetical protein
MLRIPLSSSQAKNSSDQAAALRTLELTHPETTPDRETPLADLLLYALAPTGGPRPDQGIVLGVAAELESLAMFVEGPLSVTLEMMARRIRAAVDLARRMAALPNEAP